MPGDAQPICRGPQIRQISNSSDSNDRVNRDLEQLYRTLNRVIRCQSSMADALDSLSGGSFAGGGGAVGGATGGNGLGESGNPTPPIVLRVSTGSNYTIPDHFSGIVFIEATAGIDVTLPDAESDHPIQVQSIAASAGNMALKTSGGTTLATIMPGGVCLPPVVEDANNVPGWATKAAVMYSSGALHIPGDLVLVGPGKLFLQDTVTGNYFDITVASGAVTPHDTSLSDPPTPPP